MKLKTAPLLRLPLLGALVAKTESGPATPPRVQVPASRVYIVVDLENVIGRTAKVI